MKAKGLRMENGDVLAEQGQWTAALESGDVELCRDLINRGSDVNANMEAFGVPPLVVAVRKGYFEIAELLLNHGAEVDEPKETPPLHVACVNQQVDLARLLVKHGANLAGWSSPTLKLAAATGNQELCRVLIDAGADVNALTRDTKKTALISAAKVGAVDVCRLLIDSGADIHAAQSDGWTALMYGVDGDHLEATRLLIDRGADPSATLRCGRLVPLTAFQLAVKSNATKVLHYFLFECGEDPAQRTEGGRTMRQLAGKHVETKQLLQSAKTAVAVGRLVDVEKLDGAVGRRHRDPSMTTL